MMHKFDKHMLWRLHVILAMFVYINVLLTDKLESLATRLD